MRAIWYPLMYVCGALNVINWKLIGINYLCSFISFHLVSNSFFFFFEENFWIYSFVTYSKIKDENKSHLPIIQSIYHLWCVLNTDTIGFSVTENLSFISQDHQYTDVGPAWTFCSLSKRNISSHQTSHTLLHQISINSNYLIPARTSLSSNQINKQRNTYLLCHLLG